MGFIAKIPPEARSTLSASRTLSFEHHQGRIGWRLGQLYSMALQSALYQSARRK